jgi:hypothetical protein
MKQPKPEPDISTRKPYTRHSLNDDDFIVLKNERVIPPWKWLINTRTPVGEDAEIYERKPYGGIKQFFFEDIVATMRPKL